jgi:hypothetical protein
MQAMPSSPPARRLGHLGGLITALAVALAAGCSDEQRDNRNARPPKPPPALHELKRLETTEGPTPAQWLASRQAGQDLSEEDPRVAAYVHMLDTAGRRFREYPRMIANRAVQLEEMLAEKSMPESAPQLIIVLSSVPGDTRYVESFGALCQQYFNLRTQGLERKEALALLRTSGGTTH